MNQLRDTTKGRLRRTIASRQAEHRVPGIVGGVVRHGELLWSEGVGTADLGAPGVPPTPDQQFLIASNSKTFTAVAIMALRDEGKLDLDDTLDRFVPECGHSGLTVRRCSLTPRGCNVNPSPTSGKHSSSPTEPSW